MKILGNSIEMIDLLLTPGNESISNVFGYCNKEYAC
jgi:hypothetical protein